LAAGGNPGEAQNLAEVQGDRTLRAEVIFRGQFAKLVQCRCFLTLFPSLHVFDGDIAACAASSSVTLARFRVHTSNFGLIRALMVGITALP